MKKLALILAFSVSTTALMVPTSYAQDSGTTDTTRTDQSEEDWRNSRKRKTDKEVFEDVLNSITNGGFNINTRPPGPVDTLPEESRRHIKDSRFKRRTTQIRRCSDQQT